MNLHLIAFGKKLPGWVNEGYETYAKRLPRDMPLKLTELAPAKRSKTTTLDQILKQEGEAMLEAIPQGAYVVALDEGGTPWSTPELKNQLVRWQGQGGPVALLMGGADGLAPECKARADVLWSLSAMTFPHGLARILVAEQLYRGYTLLVNHPYHRD